MTDTGESFFDLGMRLSTAYKSYFTELTDLDGARLSAFTAEVDESVEDQARLESANAEPFAEYLHNYLAK
jgi:hypothetical protein